MNYNLLSEDILTGRVSTISFSKSMQGSPNGVGALQDKPYKEKSKSKEKKKDWKQERERKRNYD